MNENLYTVIIWLFGAMTGGLIVFGIYEIGGMMKEEKEIDQQNTTKP